VTIGPSFTTAAAPDADLLAPTLTLADSSVTCLTDADIRGPAECQGGSRGSENDSGSSEDGLVGAVLGSDASVLMTLATTESLVP
jgi:hypothetical protein